MSQKNLNTTLSNNLDVNNIYYRGYNFLIKHTKELAKFTSGFSVLTVCDKHLTRCIEVVIPGIQRTLIIVIDDTTGLLFRVVVSDRSLLPEVASQKTFTPYI